jgi:hypothetical protein
MEERRFEFAALAPSMEAWNYLVAFDFTLIASFVIASALGLSRYARFLTRSECRSGGLYRPNYVSLSCFSRDLCESIPIPLVPVTPGKLRGDWSTSKRFRLSFGVNDPITIRTRVFEKRLLHPMILDTRYQVQKCKTTGSVVAVRST